MPSVRVDIADRQELLDLDRAALRKAVRAVLRGEAYPEGRVSLAIVDDATIRDVHRRFLKIDEATDVLSFVLDRRDGYVEGEIIVSAETAASAAAQYGWTPADELLLYTIHGALHLAGYEDHPARRRAEMRAREEYYLGRLGPRAGRQKNLDSAGRNS